jgi:dockerin type I repeat protein
MFTGRGFHHLEQLNESDRTMKIRFRLSYNDLMRPGPHTRLLAHAQGRYLLAALVALAAVVLAYVIINAHASSVIGDLNNDGTVNIYDLSILLADWGTTNPVADLNHDGTVNIFDLSILLSHWGQTGTPTPTYTAPVNVPTMLADLKGVNYYPSANAWSYMWTNWDATTFDSDMAKIAATHANSVRIIIPANTFGFPTPSPTMLDELSQAISIANAHGLTVDLTLFDGYTAYSVPDSQTWANAVLGPYKNDARIAYIDLQNEIQTSNSSAVTWAQAMLPYVHNLVGYTPVTVSANTTTILSQEVAAGFPVDFYEFHYYGNPGLAYNAFTQAIAAVNNQPLYIGETGYSTYPENQFYTHLDQNQSSQEAEQELYLRTVFYAAKSLGLPTPRWWIYSDFTQSGVPPTTFTYSSAPTQYYYGLYRTDGSAKPSATTLSSIFNGGAIDLGFNNSFEQLDSAGLPIDWQTWQNPSLGFTATFASDCTAAHTGSCSAEISNSISDSSGTPGFYLEPVQYIVPGGSYTATVYAKGQSATGLNRITLAWYDSNFNYLGKVASAALPTGTTNWQQLSVTATAPANAGYMELHLESGNNTGAVRFDDATFTAN